MSDFSPDDFKELLNIIRASIDNYTKCDNTRSDDCYQGVFPNKY